MRQVEVKFEQSKSSEKTDQVQSMQKVKKLEVQVRELKAKA